MRKQSTAAAVSAFSSVGAAAASAAVARAAKVGNVTDAEYAACLHRFQIHFADTTNGRPLFMTSAKGAKLYERYRRGFPAGAARQHHTCSACQHFIERFGGLVVIDPETGAQRSALWNSPVLWNDKSRKHYGKAFDAMNALVLESDITGVFIPDNKIAGHPLTGPWRHLSVDFGDREVLSEDKAFKAMAEKRHEFETINRALPEYNRHQLEVACKLLRTDALYRSEKVLGVAEWLLERINELAKHNVDRKNLLWLAVSGAPAGFCHPRSSMIGTLLDDIASGATFAEVSQRFAAKMHPLRYQRPTAEPAAGTVIQAEKLVHDLDAAGSLARRYARLGDVVPHALWYAGDALKRTRPQVPPGGVFSNVPIKSPGTGQKMTPAKGNDLKAPAQRITWAKFRQQVLPEADRIQVLAQGHAGAYAVLVTADNPDAPPILQWDRPDARNPVSWYFVHHGRSASSMGLQGGTYVDVDAVTLQPTMWGGEDDNPHQGRGVFFVLNGAKEAGGDFGLALFPEIMRSEFHGVRSVIEAFSHKGQIKGRDKPHAAGILLKAGDTTWDWTLRVWSGGLSSAYLLDRWD